jgi:hypothetical protein
MSTSTDEIKIDLDELDAKKTANGAKDPAKDDAKVVKTEPEVKTDDTPLVNPEAGLEILKKQLDAERARADAAEKRAADSAASEARARTDVGGSQLDLLKNTIASLTQANDVMGDQVADLQAAGDFKGAQKVQREMVKNEAKILRLEEGKAGLEKHLEEQKKAPPPSTGDPVEDLAVQLTPQSAAWVRAHPEFARSPQKYAQMIAAHNLVTGYGIKSDTEEYFSEIEKALRIVPVAAKTTNGDATKHVDNQNENPMSDAAIPTKKAAPASAPVSRSGNASNTRPNTVTLTAEEVEMAALNGQTPEEYARNKLALKKEGRLN